MLGHYLVPFFVWECVFTLQAGASCRGPVLWSRHEAPSCFLVELSRDGRAVWAPGMTQGWQPISYACLGATV